MLAEVTLQIENERTRVSRYRLAPGTTTGFHRHKHDYVIVPISSGSLLLKDANSEHTVGLESGKPYFRSAGIEHEAINAGSEDLIFVEVELL